MPGVENLLLTVISSWQQHEESDPEPYGFHSTPKSASIECPLFSGTTGDKITDFIPQPDYN